METSSLKLVSLERLCGNLVVKRSKPGGERGVLKNSKQSGEREYLKNQGNKKKNQMNC
jgi:hypothetical protein